MNSKEQKPLNPNIPDYQQNITFKIRDKQEGLKYVKDKDIFDLMGGSTKPSNKKPAKKKKQPKKKRTRKKK
tara:strand:- start:2525 stop:2737 length:213 start_codon:yes stop_codon:yes gene_type:complete